MLLCINHDPHMPRPNDQVSGAWRSHARKIFVSGKKLEGTRVWIVKARVGINLVNDMRTVQRPRLWLLLL